jgi:hypothetical protein
MAADANTLLSAAHIPAATAQQSITFLNPLYRFPRLAFPLTLG